MEYINKWFLTSALCGFMFGCAALAAETSSNTVILKTETATDELAIKKAGATMNPTQGHDVEGLVTFTKVEGGVQIVADITGLTPGNHGFHIHEYGDCSAPDGSSAGGHFNPTHKKHAGPDSADRHVGDLGNIFANQNGVGHYERVDKVIQLDGADSIVGRSVIVHANPDDYKTQPSGNAGGRVSCGVIVEQ